MFPRLLVVVVLLQKLATSSAHDIIPPPLEDELQALQWITVPFENGEKETSAVDEIYQNPFVKPEPNVQHQKKVSADARKNMWDLNGGKNMGGIGLTEQKNERLSSTLERGEQRIHSTPDGPNKGKPTKIKEDPRVAEEHSLVQDLENLQQRISMALEKSQKAKITPGDAVGLKPVKEESDNVLTEHLWPFGEEMFLRLPNGGSYGVRKSEVGENSESIDYLGLAENEDLQKSVDLRGIIGGGFQTNERVEGRGKMQGDTKEAGRKAEKMLVGENGKMEERMRERERMKDGRWEKEREGERRIVENEKETGKRMIAGDFVMGGTNDGGKERYKVMVEKLKEGETILTGRPSNVIGRIGERENVGERPEEGVEEPETLGDTVATKGRTREQDEGMTENRMEHDGQDEQIVGQQNEMKERMRERERVMGDMKEREREGERGATGGNRNMRERKHEAMVGDPNHAMIRFQQRKEDWLPGWKIKDRSRGEAKERKTGGGVQVEMQREREVEGHKMSYI